jgi:NADPH2:quinone reductase
VVRAQTGGAGADVILDMVGGDYVNRNYEAAAVEGRIVQIAFLHRPVAEADFSKLMMKRLTHTGSTLRARSIRFKADLAKAVEEAVWPLIADGRFRPVMDSEFALADAADAHRRIDDSAHIGKIVLQVSP